MEDRPELNELEPGYRGRRSTVDLPRPILIDGQRILRVHLSQGVNKDILSELRERPTVDALLDDSDVAWRKAVGRTAVSADENRAIMKIGDVFRSEIVVSKSAD
jgi:hypothetical protein